MHWTGEVATHAVCSTVPPALPPSLHPTVSLPCTPYSPPPVCIYCAPAFLRTFLIFGVSRVRIVTASFGSGVYSSPQFRCSAAAGDPQAVESDFRIAKYSRNVKR